MKVVKKLKRRVYSKVGGLPYYYLYPRLIPIGYYMNRGFHVKYTYSFSDAPSSSPSQSQKHRGVQ